MDYELTEQNYPQFFQACKEYAEEIKRLYILKLERDGHRVTGDLINSVQVSVVPSNDGIDIVLDLADHWLYVEHGRKPGRFPPTDKLEEFVLRKPVIPRESSSGTLPSVRTLAYLIGRKIAKEGIPAGNELSETLDELRSSYSTKLQEALQEDFDNLMAYLLQEQIDTMLIF